MTPELEALNAYRLEKRWSFKQLAQAMTNVGCAMSHHTLYNLCIRHANAPRHFDRTLYTIRRFLNIIQARDESRSSRCGGV